MNEILLNDEIGSWGITAQNFNSQLSNMNGDVTIKINSPGGSIFEGVEIFNAIKEYSKGKVHVVITSLAASIASYIALAADKISVYDNATYMIHNAWNVAIGDYRDMKNTALLLESLDSMLQKKYIAKTGKTKEEVKQLCDDETYFFGEEILAHGFCDEIISVENDDTEKMQALALGKEKFRACIKNTNDNFNKDEFVQAAAKLTKDGFLALEKEPKNDENLEEKVADSAEQEKREREIIEREVRIYE